MRVVNLLEWSVSTRFWIGFAVLIFVVVVSAVVSSLLIDRADRDLSDAVDVQGPLERAVLQTEAGANRLALAVFAYAREGNYDDIELAHQAGNDLREYTTEFFTLAHTDEVRQLGQQLDQTCQQYRESRYEILALVDQRDIGLQSFREDMEAVSDMIDENLRSTIDSSGPDATEKMEGALGMELAVDEISGAVELYVARQQPAMQQWLEDARANYQSYLDLYQNTSLSAYEQSWLSKIDEDFKDSVEDGFELMAITDDLQALLLQLEEDRTAIETLLNEQIQPLVNGGAAKAADDAKTAMSVATIFMIALGVTGIVGGSVLAWLTYKRFRQSVRGLQNGAQAVANGKLDQRFDVDTKDEFGQVGFALNQMLQNLGRSREALGESEETAWALLDATTDSVTLIDTRGTILASNEIAAERFGRSLEQMIDENLYDLLPADMRAAMEAQVGEVIRSGKPSRFENEREGVIYDQRVFPVFDPKTQRVRRLALFSSDVTTRKWVEDVAERLGRRNELILESAGDGIYGLDIQGRTTFVNPAAARMLGYKPDDLIGERHHELVHHSRPNGMPYPSQECPIYAAFKDGIVRRSVDDEVFWRKDGTSFPVEYTSTPIIEEGKIAGAVVTFRDITERKNIETALRRTAERYRTILDSAATLVVSVDREGVIIDANAQSHRIMGRNPDEIVGHGFVDYIRTDQRADIGDKLRKVLLTGFYDNIRFNLVRKDGTDIEVNMNAAAMKDENGEYIRTICMIDDFLEPE